MGKTDKFSSKTTWLSTLTPGCKRCMGATVPLVFKLPALKLVSCIIVEEINFGSWARTIYNYTWLRIRQEGGEWGPGMTLYSSNEISQVLWIPREWTYCRPRTLQKIKNFSLERALVCPSAICWSVGINPKSTDPSPLTSYFFFRIDG